MADAEEFRADALEVAPNLHEVVLENERVRVLKYRSKTGDRADLHWHPNNVVIHTGPPAKMRFKTVDGSANDVEVPTGYVGFSEAGSHAFEQLGGEETTGYIIELK
jgi:hypothetical protein